MDSTSCPICHARTYRYCLKDRATYFRCGSCGTIFQQPLPSLQDMVDYANAEYRDGLYREYLEANDLKYATFEYRLGKVMEVFVTQSRPASPQPRLLDVGCSNGRFIEVAMRSGIDAWGLELSEGAIAAAAPQIRTRIIHGDANQIENAGMEKFDIITAFDLIEHLFDPLKFLRVLRKSFRKDGMLVVTTPDAGSLVRTLMGRAWPMLQPFQHTILLTRKASNILLKTAAYDHVAAASTRKLFTLDYLFRQLRGPNPHIFKTYDSFKNLLPSVLREHRFQLDIGEMMITATPASE